MVVNRRRISICQYFVNFFRVFRVFRGFLPVISNERASVTPAACQVPLPLKVNGPRDTFTAC
jgi:hypothetical protein